MDNLGLICRCYAEDENISQRKIAELLHISLGSAHKLVTECFAKAYLEPAAGAGSGDRYRLTEKGRSFLEQYRVDGAVILAAGFGSRFVPLTFEVPKGLVEVYGERMIERQIRQLREAGITDITVAVGYLKEKFEYLIDKYGVKLLYNPEYRSKNTLSTLYHARNLFPGRNMYLLVSDNWLRANMFHRYECGAWYSAVYMEGDTSEWQLSLTKKGRITAVASGGRDTWVMYGPAFFDRTFSERFIPLLEEDYEAPGTEKDYWEHVLLRHMDELEMYENYQPADQVYEFENLEELRSFDPRYRNHSDNRALQLVSEVLRIPESAITNIRCLKSGMTNQSFLFEAAGNHYICRIPGPGTAQLIDRRQEHAAYAAVKSLDITESVLHFDPENGFKIAKYYDGAKNADFTDPAGPDAKACLAVLRRLHASGLRTEHSFDIGERIDYYEGLCRHRQQDLFEDYDTVRGMMDTLVRSLARLEQPGWTAARCAAGIVPEHPCREMVLSHIDPVCDNFLMLPDGGIRLIDWEYAGMQDPLIDIAMSSIYAYYTAEQTETLLTEYLERAPRPEERFITFAFAALGGFLWALWAVFKSMSGIEFGDYTIIMYRYAKEYYRKLVRELPQYMEKER